jgi:S1-C subfamily serine protease
VPADPETHLAAKSPSKCATPICNLKGTNVKTLRSIVLVGAVCVVLAPIAQALAADAVDAALTLTAPPPRTDVVAAAKDVVKNHGPSVVRVTGTVKLTMAMKGMNMPPREQRFDVLGTIIDPSGLTVVSNSTIDVSAMLGSMSMGEEDGEAVKLQVKTEFSALKIRLADGTEVPGRIVLKDQDWDMAFVMPDNQSEQGKKLAGKYPALNLDDNATVAALDEVIALGRLGKNLDYQSAVQIGRISAVVAKPRTLYATSGNNLVAGLGIPVFNAAGKLVGIQLMRNSGPVDLTASDMSAMVSSMAPIILPAADVAEVAKQALIKKDAKENAKAGNSAPEPPAATPAATPTAAPK